MDKFNIALILFMAPLLEGVHILGIPVLVNLRLKTCIKKTLEKMNIEKSPLHKGKSSAVGIYAGSNPASRTISLDIGCALGTKRNGCLGLDVLKHTNVDIQADACHLPLKNESVDYLYSRECIQHIKDSDFEALKEMVRVLKPHSEATIIVSSFIGWSIWRVGISSRTYRYLRLYTDQSFKKKLLKAGFSSVLIGHVTLGNKKITSRRFLRHIRLGYHDIIGECKK
jgi:SAM-dependent methyltransferase